MQYLVPIILVFNILWFAAAFHLFSLKSIPASKMLLPREKRIEPYNAIVSHLFKFLGGFNLSLMVLSIIALINYQTLMDNQFGAALFLVFFIAHGSQFWYNVPLAMNERKNIKPIWPVLKGRMYFIFRMDLFLAVCNLMLSVYLFAVA